MLSDYEKTSFTDGSVTKPVYARGKGPAVIIMHELPGITPEVIRFADWVADAGFQIHMPELTGTAERPATLAYTLSTMAGICISREFHVLASHHSSPVTNWLRALSRDVYAKAGGKGIGAVGMCFSGNFALAMMMEPCLMAPVLSQPSLPFPFGARRKAALHLSPDELRCVKTRCAKGERVLGLRFKGDPGSPPERFETLRRELGANFESIEIDDKYANPDSTEWTPHSVLTNDLIDRDGEPTKEAAKRVIAFLTERLKP